MAMTKTTAFPRGLGFTGSYDSWLYAKIRLVLAAFAKIQPYLWVAIAPLRTAAPSQSSGGGLTDLLRIRNLRRCGRLRYRGFELTRFRGDLILVMDLPQHCR